MPKLASCSIQFTNRQKKGKKLIEFPLKTRQQSDYLISNQMVERNQPLRFVWFQRHQWLFHGVCNRNSWEEIIHLYSASLINTNISKTWFQSCEINSNKILEWYLAHIYSSHIIHSNIRRPLFVWRVPICLPFLSGKDPGFPFINSASQMKIYSTWSASLSICPRAANSPQSASQQPPSGIERWTL